MRSYWALMYSTVFSSPAEPGARPSNSSEARVVTRVRRSSASISGLKACSAAGAASGAATSAGAAGSRLHAASSRLPAQARIRGERIRWAPGKAEPPILRRPAAAARAGSPGHASSRRLRRKTDRRRRPLPRKVGGRASVLRRPRRAVGGGGRAGDLAHPRGVVHVQVDLALEHQLALDHRAGADHDPGLALVDLYREPVGRGLLDPDSAGHVRADADGDVAADRRDAAGQ